jgi:hypothetical protein
MEVVLIKWLKSWLRLWRMLEQLKPLSNPFLESLKMNSKKLHQQGGGNAF